MEFKFHHGSIALVMIGFQLFYTGYFYTNVSGGSVITNHPIETHQTQIDLVSLKNWVDVGSDSVFSNVFSV